MYPKTVRNKVKEEIMDQEEEDINQENNTKNKNGKRMKNFNNLIIKSMIHIKKKNITKKEK